MLTALIIADASSEDLAVTLGALVPAVVDGLLGDAVVVATHHDPAVTRIAEVAGASLVVTSGGDPWLMGAAAARRDWLLCLEAGDVPGDGWLRATDRFLASAIRGNRPLGRFSRPGAASALLRFKERWTGTRSVRAGDLVRRSWLMSKTGRERPVQIGAVMERHFA